MHRFLVIALVALVVMMASPFATARGERPVHGTLAGRAFVPTRVEISDLGMNEAKLDGKVYDRVRSYTLTFRTGKDFFADQEAVIFFVTEERERLAGRTLISRPFAFGTEGYSKQHYPVKKPASVGRGIGAVHVSTKTAAKDLPSTEIFSDMVDAKLQFLSQRGQTVVGRISLKTKGPKGVVISGGFTATLKAFGS